MEEMEMEKIRNFFKDDSGATMVEYGLMIALIAVGARLAMPRRNFYLTENLKILR
jgi:hypothetical protein